MKLQTIKLFIAMCVICTPNLILSLSPFKIAIIGLGSRSHDILLECFTLHDNIQVVAACDDCAIESHNSYMQNLMRIGHATVPSFKKAFEGTSIYKDTDENIVRMFARHKDIDAVLITSTNPHHGRHLALAERYSPCKNIYMEKPLFRTLEEYNSFTLKPETDVLIGLTLRYSTMANIIATQLKSFKHQLGTLQHVRAWETIKFCQGLSNFMMSWRKFISLSGGLLLEKCVHDLDLAFFFMHELDLDPEAVAIKTKASHALYTKENRERILNEMTHNEPLRQSFVTRERVDFQPYIPFTYDAQGNVDWPTILTAIFRDFPDNNDFCESDIIPDTHRIEATILTQTRTAVTFELDVTMAEFVPNTERGMRFIFEQGEVIIDVMRSVMSIALYAGQQYSFDLHTLNSDHADGDLFIAQAILGMQDKNQITATFHDPIVQFANLFALVSEKQALLHDESVWSMKKKGDIWQVTER